MKQRLYLYRLMIVVAILLVPLTVFCLVLWQRSFTELQYNNQKYYESRVEDFGETLNRKIQDLKEHATALIVSSKNKDSIFWDASERFSSNSYWYKGAVNEIINQHYCQNVNKWGIYYYGADRVITTSGTMNAEEYLELILNVQDGLDLFADWFLEENYEYQKELFATTNVVSEIDGQLLFGIMNKLGRTQDKVLLFYIMDSTDFKAFEDGIYGEEGINFYVFGKNSHDIYLSLIADESAVLEVIDKTIISENDIYNSVYMVHDNVFPLTYLVQVTEDAFQNSIISFYQDTKEILYMAALLSFFACGVVIYFVYKPVYLLTESLEYEGGNEFSMFRSVLENKHTQLSDQRMLIMDLLINNLVKGFPISWEKLSKLGVVNKQQSYCVMFLNQYVLAVHDVEQVTKEIEGTFRCKLFVTDWEGEKESILIVFMEEDNCNAIIEALRKWFSSNLSGNVQFNVGKVVHSLDEIKLSYASCCSATEKKRAKSDEIERQKRQQKQQEEIIKYIDEHLCDEELSQTKIADAFEISVYTLSRLFRNQVGIGFTDYINGKRIEYSKELLLTTEYAINDISSKVGYANVNYFCKMFKNSVGISPGKFRDESKNN